MLQIIKRANRGTDAPLLTNKAGFAERSVRNILYSAFKENKIKEIREGQLRSDITLDAFAK